MLGWLIIVSRCVSRTLREARGDSDEIRSLLIKMTRSPDVLKSTDADQRIATWQTGLGGLNWARSTREQRPGRVDSYGGCPEVYLIPCEEFVARLDSGLPHERPVWASAPGDILADRWLGRTTINSETLARCIRTNVCSSKLGTRADQDDASCRGGRAR